MSSSNSNHDLVAGYVPKATLSYVGIACYGLLALVFWFNFFRHGRKYMLTLCISALTMAIGFGIRIPLSTNPTSSGIYIGYTLFTLLSPCGFIATEYILLPRIAALIHAEDCLFLSSRKIVRIFVGSDITTFFLQAAGGGMTTAKGNMANIGKWLSLVGLVAQCVSFGIFILLAVMFMVRVSARYPEKWSNVTTTGLDNRPVTLNRLEDWTTVYYTIMYAAVGIMARCIFRVVEYAMGRDGYLRSTEWCVFVLDHLPLFLAIMIWTVIWPPMVLERDDRFAHRVVMGDHALAYVSSNGNENKV
ncbi:hypothetical protein IAR55_002003 [Kwoniella newhampshirensis]|uniref:RTA1 domain protein n=1 Tax=Kwoniella newhampshirensis TaxID=1651941 RepID=A0AAW0Z3Q3_9TREE